jgi:hypothetical protein
MSNKVYIVTSGFYSDYTIEEVFSSIELAKEYVDTKGDDFRVEDYEIDKPIIRKKGIFSVSISLYSKKVFNVWKGKHTSYKDLFQFESNFYNNWINFYIESDSKDRAIKIACERYAFVLANEKTNFPLLREKGIYENVSECPFYNFKTFKIVTPCGYIKRKDFDQYIETIYNFYNNIGGKHKFGKNLIEEIKKNKITDN